MDDLDMFKRYRMNRDITDGIVMNELSSQIGYMEDVSNTNFDNLRGYSGSEDPLLSNYWLGFNCITDEMLSIMDAREETIPNRRQRMLGMIDACNMVLQMIEDGDFNDS
jgi:hypothetical protein